MCRSLQLLQTQLNNPRLRKCLIRKLVRSTACSGQFPKQVRGLNRAIERNLNRQSLPRKRREPTKKRKAREKRGRRAGADGRKDPLRHSLVNKICWSSQTSPLVCLSKIAGVCSWRRSLIRAGNTPPAMDRTRTHPVSCPNKRRSKVHPSLRTNSRTHSATTTQSIIPACRSSPIPALSRTQISATTVTSTMLVSDLP